MKFVVKFWSLPLVEKQLIIEASTLLLISYVCVKSISFRFIIYSLDFWNYEKVTNNNSFDTSISVRTSLTRVLSCLPLNDLCLTRSVAEFVMLRRRGIPAVLVAGVKISEKQSLHAHAWIETGHFEASAENSEFTAVLKIGQAAGK